MKPELTTLVDLLREPAIVRDLAGRELHRNLPAEGLREDDDWARLRVGDVVVYVGPERAEPVVRVSDLLEAEVLGAAEVLRGRLGRRNQTFAAQLGATPPDAPPASLFLPDEQPDLERAGPHVTTMVHSDGHHVPAKLAALRTSSGDRLLLVKDLGARRRGVARLRALSRAGAQLRSATDEDQAARRVSAAVVPDLADVCHVDLTQGDQTRRVGIARRDPSRTAAIDPVTPSARLEARLLVRALDDPEARELGSASVLNTLRVAGVRSCILVPIAANGTRMGRIALYSLNDRPALGEDDLEVAQELAARVGSALQRIRLARELRREGSTFRALVESTPQLIFSADPDGRFGYLNHRWVEYTGLPIDQIRYADWRSLVHPDDVEGVVEAWKVPPGTVVEARARLRGAAGQWRWFLVRAAGAYDDAGALVRWVGSCADVHESTRREEHAELVAAAAASLEAPDDPDRALADLAIAMVPRFADYCAIYLCDDDRCRLAHLHHRAPELAGRIRALHQSHPLDLRSMQRDERGVRQSEILHFPPGGEAPRGFGGIGSAGVTSMIVAPMSVGDRALGLLTFASTSSRRTYDEDDRRAADEIARRAALFLQHARLFAVAQAEREKAEEANRLKDAFLGMLSHELRTPLAALAGWTQLLVRGRVPPDQVAHAVSVIERNARSLGQLIDDLLDVSRIVTGHLRFTSHPLDLAHEVRRAIDEIRPIADEKGVGIVTRIHPVATMEGDARRLRQAVWNLLSNAVKFTPHGGCVEVELSERERRAVLQVADDGVGIEPEFIGRLFDPFRQADSSTTRAHGGLGLGLAIVKYVVEMHGGTVHVRSPGPGEGSVFTVLLPTSRAERPREEAGGGPELERLQGVVVLVVESDPDTLDLLTTLLEATGATVVHAHDASQARACLWRERPDLMLAAVRLPGEDGLSLMRSIRRLPPDQGGDVPAVAITAFSSDVDRRKALQAGFQAHVSKPLDPERLVELLRTVYLASRR